MYRQSGRPIEATRNQRVRRVESRQDEHAHADEDQTDLRWQM